MWEKVFESLQITKEEFDTFEHWKDDQNVIDYIISRKLGCEKCRDKLIHLNPENCMDLIMTSLKFKSMFGDKHKIKIKVCSKLGDKYV